MTLLLAVIGIGTPGIGLLLARWLTSEDTTRSIERHRQALAVLGDVTARSTAVPR